MSASSFKRLYRLPAGSFFQDANGQAFVKTGEVAENCPWFGGARIKLHAVRCLWSPFRGKLGPISSAFFTSPGAVLWLPGMQEVLK